MAKWKNDTWKSIDNINNNKKFETNDGIKLSDINTIFNNIFFLKGD